MVGFSDELPESITPNGLPERSGGHLLTGGCGGDSDL